MMIPTVIAAAMLLQSAAADQPAVQQPIALVQTEEDPAALLNLGVRLAQAGEREAARAAFQKVRRMRVDYTLETVDGRYVYPPDLAREALVMLDQGAFDPQ